MTGLAIDHLAKTFADGSVALDGIDLAIADGELLVLVGPSGCGKSTLLRCIAGLEQPTAGRVHLGRRDITDLAPERRDIAMVFQSYALYPHLTVAGNLAFPLKMAKVPKAERQRRVAELARTMAIGELLERRPAQLSGGQRQRVAMGRALIRQPEAFLMDEPLSNLDARLRGQLRREIAELQRRLAITTVYVTHDQVEAMTMGDRLCVLRGGRIQQIGSAEDCYRRPANRFVAGFLGSPPLHLLRAALVREDAAWSLVWDGGRLPADALAATRGEDLDALATVGDWGLRSEALRLTDDGAVASEVVHVEHLGHEHLVHCRAPWPVVDDDPEVPTGPLVVRHGAGGASPALGDAVRLAVDSSALLAFGPDGRRV